MSRITSFGTLKVTALCIIAAKLLTGCNAESMLTDCDTLAGKRYLSSALVAQAIGAFPGHVVIDFDSSHANISVGNDTEQASYSCQDSTIELAITGAELQTISLTPSGFNAYIPGQGDYRFELAAPAGGTCHIPHSDVFRAESFATSPFDYWVFHAFQAKVDVQKGSGIKTYEVDCDSGDLHFHLSLEDESPLVVTLGVMAEFRYEDLTLQADGETYKFIATDHSFNSCLLDGDSLCAQTESGEYLLFPNLCLAQQVDAIEVDGALCL